MNDDMKPVSILELTTLIDGLVKEGDLLYKQGLAELIEEYGSKEDIPLTARADNLKMGEGYNRAAEAILEGLLATFNYMTNEIGPTGMQASWAVMNFLGKALGIEGPARLVKADDYLYPQNDNDVTRWLGSPEVRQHLHEKALTKLAEHRVMPFHEKVQERLDRLAAAPDTWEARP